jgi:hypothetical protein
MSNQAAPAAMADKVGAVFGRVGKFAGEDAQQLLHTLVSPASLHAIAITMVVWGVAQVFGVGEVVDIIMLAVGIATLGKNAIDFAADLAHACGKTLHARTDDDLDDAAQYLGKAIVEGGVELILVLLLRKDLGQIKVKVRNLSQMKPGLLKIGPAPPPGVKPRIQFKQYLGRTNPGWTYGETYAYGDMTIAREGFRMVGNGKAATPQWVKFTADEKTEVILHELVHRFFSPRFGPLAEFRASLNISGYSRLYLLKYLEEAMAQGYAATRTRGLSGIWEGIAFPVKNGYVSIADFTGSLGYAGVIALGPIQVGGRATNVYFTPGPSAGLAPSYAWQAAGPR